MIWAIVYVYNFNFSEVKKSKSLKKCFWVEYTWRNVDLDATKKCNWNILNEFKLIRFWLFKHFYIIYYLEKVLISKLHHSKIVICQIDTFSDELMILRF